MRAQLIYLFVFVVLVFIKEKSFAQTIKEKRTYICFDSNSRNLVEREIYNNIGKVQLHERYSFNDSVLPFASRKFHYNDTFLIDIEDENTITIYEYNTSSDLIKKIFKSKMDYACCSTTYYYFYSNKKMIKSRCVNTTFGILDTTVDIFVYNDKGMLMSDTAIGHFKLLDGSKPIIVNEYQYFTGGYVIFNSETVDNTIFNSVELLTKIDSVFTDSFNRIVRDIKYSGKNVTDSTVGATIKKAVGHDEITKYYYNNVGLLSKKVTQIFQGLGHWSWRAILYEYD
jgi:hypothetical protein